MLTSRDRPKSTPYPRLKNSKRTSKSQFTVLENRKSKQNGPIGAPGPASTSPWSAKRGTLPKLSTFLSELKEGPFGEKKFRKKSHNAEKLKRGPFGIFKHPICCKISKKLKGDALERKNFTKKSHDAEKLKGGTLWGFQHPFCRKNIEKLKGEIFIFGKKISQCRKKLKRGTLWDFPTSILTQNSKKVEGGPFGEKIFRKKVSQCRKKIEREDPLASPGMVCYAEKQEKPFWFSSLGQIVQFVAIIFCRTFKNYFGQFVWIEKKSL